MNPESAALRNIDRNRQNRLELSPTIKNAHERAMRDVLTNPDYAIQEDEFVGVYSANDIAADRAEVARLERIFSQRDTPEEVNTKKIADVLEAIVLMQSEMNEWLGSATTLRTSKFDDYKNKVDMLAEWSHPEDGSRVLALAVDVTFGSTSVEKKLSEIRDEINSGTLGKVRYFRDSDNQFMGTRNNVPRTVIGISQPMVEELAQLWLANDNKALAKHSVQRQFLVQIVHQLTTMRDYAARIGKDDVVKAYNQALVIARPLLDSKSVIERGDYSEDPVAKSIREKTKEFFFTPQKKTN
jgi:hypothetical protein